MAESLRANLAVHEIVPREENKACAYNSITDAEQRINGTPITQAFASYRIRKFHPLPGVAEADLCACTLEAGNFCPSSAIINVEEWLPLHLERKRYIRYAF